MSNKPHIINNSGNEEWYTPPMYITAARSVLGEINFDPASSEIANRIVMAKRFVTAEQNGLTEVWQDRFWLNPPYARGKVDAFVSKIGLELDCGSVTCGIVLTNNATDTGWWHKLAGYSQYICFAKGRIKYLGEDLKPANSPLQGQTFFLINRKHDKLIGDLFVSEFSEFGKVVSVV